MIKINVDLRGELFPVRNQGRRPTCLAFALSSAHEHHIKHSELLSVEYLYFYAVSLMTGAHPDAGASMFGAAQALALVGQPSENSWPYQPIQLYPPIWNPPVVTNLHTVVMNWGILSFDEICASLDGRRCIVLGLIITEAFRQASAVGVIPALAPDINRGGHAVLAVGYGLDTSGRRHMLIRNSWGPKWGLDGHAWVSEDYLTRQLIQIATLM